MATFGIVIAIGVAALIACDAFGGPRIPPDHGGAIDEVVASEVPELVEGWRRSGADTVGDLAEDAAAVLDYLAIDRAHVCGLSLGLRPRIDDVRDLGQVVVYDVRKRRGASLVAAYHQQVAAAASAPPRCGASGRRRTDARRAWRHRLRTRGPVRRFGDRGVPRPVVG